MKGELPASSWPSRVLVTGGAGFIGSALVRYLMAATDVRVLNVDKLTYAGNLESLAGVLANPRHEHRRVDICDERAMRQALSDFRPDAVMHLAAESHVDRSIDGPDVFMETNVTGTYRLLKQVCEYWRTLPQEEQSGFRFHHISTDEVYGSLGATGRFSEESAYRPNSPYSASKAASDHIVRAWNHTYGMPVVTSNCSNNYGPYQFPEKLIPLMILNGLARRPLPVYGRGENVRDWLFVDDHAHALWLILTRGRPGETYLIGGHGERTNLQVVEEICDAIERLQPGVDQGSLRQLISFVTDRPGHDHRYAIDASKAEHELGWQPAESFSSGLERTVAWYMEHSAWWQRIQDGSYRGERLGLIGET